MPQVFVDGIHHIHQTTIAFDVVNITHKCLCIDNQAAVLTRIVGVKAVYKSIVEGAGYHGAKVTKGFSVTTDVLVEEPGDCKVTSVIFNIHTVAIDISSAVPADIIFKCCKHTVPQITNRTGYFCCRQHVSRAIFLATVFSHTIWYGNLICSSANSTGIHHRYRCRYKILRTDFSGSVTEIVVAHNAIDVVEVCSG